MNSDPSWMINATHTLPRAACYEKSGLRPLPPGGACIDKRPRTVTSPRVRMRQVGVIPSRSWMAPCQYMVRPNPNLPIHYQTPPTAETQTGRGRDLPPVEADS